MYKAGGIDWKNCPVETMSRDHCPSNAVWIDSDDPKVAWAKTVSVIEESRSALVVWDGFPVLGAEVYARVRSVFSNNNAFQIKFDVPSKRIQPILSRNYRISLIAGDCF